MRGIVDLVCQHFDKVALGVTFPKDNPYRYLLQLGQVGKVQQRKLVFKTSPTLYLQQYGFSSVHKLFDNFRGQLITLSDEAAKVDEVCETQRGEIRIEDLLEKLGNHRKFKGLPRIDMRVVGELQHDAQCSLLNFKLFVGNQLQQVLCRFVGKLLLFGFGLRSRVFLHSIKFINAAIN